jgi:hypothetical protein
LGALGGVAGKWLGDKAIPAIKGLFRPKVVTQQPKLLVLDLPEPPSVDIKVPKPMLQETSTAVRGAVDDAASSYLPSGKGFKLGGDGLPGNGASKPAIYRAVSELEYQDILNTGKFRLGSSYSTKLFTSSFEYADEFGRELYKNAAYRVIKVEVPNKFYQKLFRFEADGKPALSVTPHLLKQLNRAARGQILKWR